MTSAFQNWLRSTILIATFFNALCCVGQPAEIRRGAGGGFGAQVGRTNRGPSPTAIQARARSNQVREARRSSGLIEVHFHAAIYEIQGASNRLAALDATALENSATTDETLLKTLQQTGKARVLYRFDQPINVYSGEIVYSASDPVVTGMQSTAKGPLVSSISYANLGAILRLSAQPPSNDPGSNLPEVNLKVQLAEFVPGDIETLSYTAGAHSVPRVINLEQTRRLDFSRPQIIVRQSLEFADDAQAAPAAYVLRYTFDRLKTEPGEKSATEWPAEGFATTNMPARFQATIYKLDAMANRLGTLDATALAGQAGTDGSPPKVLATAGKWRVLYQIDQPVNACAEQIQITTNESIATSVRLGIDGVLRPSYTVRRLGAGVELSSQMIPKGKPGEGPAVTTCLHLACELPTDINLAPDLNATAPNTLTMENTEPLQFNQPRVFTAARSVYDREQGAPVVYIIRYVFKPL